MPESRRRSWPGVIAGLAMALAIPVLYRTLALLVEQKIVSYDPVHAILDPLVTISFLEVLLGPLGIVMAGRAATITGWALLAVVIAALPVLAVIWLVCVLTLAGALGAPL